MAGDAASGFADGVGSAARFLQPYGLVLDANGNLFVSDSYIIRKVTMGGVVTHYSGNTLIVFQSDGSLLLAGYTAPRGLAIAPSGTIFVADYYRIRTISSTTVATLAGAQGGAGYVDGVGAAARFNGAYGVAVDSAGQYLYVADTFNYRIRRVNIATRNVDWYAGNGIATSTDGPANVAGFSFLSAITWSNGTLLLLDYNTLRRIVPPAP